MNEHGEKLTTNYISKAHAAYHYDLPPSIVDAWIRDGELAEYRTGPAKHAAKVINVDELDRLLKDYLG